jgi:hypothetical protein
MIDFDLVYERIPYAKAIAFDTCHKIYLLMDDEQVRLMREYEYDPLITKDEMSDHDMFETIKKWFDESCGLRFVQAVSTVEGNPNEGFETLIEQGATDEEECDECGELGCDGYYCQEACERCGDRTLYEDDLCRLCYEDSQEDEDE